MNQSMASYHHDIDLDDISNDWLDNFVNNTKLCDTVNISLLWAFDTLDMVLALRVKDHVLTQIQVKLIDPHPPMDQSE